MIDQGWILTGAWDTWKPRPQYIWNVYMYIELVHKDYKKFSWTPLKKLVQSPGYAYEWWWNYYDRRGEEG